PLAVSAHVAADVGEGGEFLERSDRRTSVRSGIYCIDLLPDQSRPPSQAAYAKLTNMFDVSKGLSAAFISESSAESFAFDDSHMRSALLVILMRAPAGTPCPDTSAT